MKAGELRHRIRIEQDEGTEQDGAGHDIADWQKLAEVWSAVEPLTGQELWVAQQVNPTVTIRVRMRYLEGLAPHMRIIHKQRTLEIESVINIEERNIEHHAMCKEEVA